MKMYPYFKSLVTCAGILVMGLFAASANAAPVFFSDRTTFDNEAGPLAGFEDFEEANLGLASQPGPWNSATDDAVFSPGDIADGVTFVAPFGGLTAVGAGFPSGVIGSNLSSAALDIVFAPGVNAVGLDIFHTDGPNLFDITISLFDLGDVLIDELQTDIDPAGGFFGVIDMIGTIGRIRLDATDGLGFEIIDNIAFGFTDAGRVSTPGSLALLGLGLAGLGLARRDKKVA